MVVGKRIVLVCAIALLSAGTIRADDDDDSSGGCRSGSKPPGASPPAVAPAAPAPAAPDWQGSYTAKAAGYYCGTDSVSVNSADKLHLNLKLTIKDNGGNQVNFNVPNLDIVDGYFKGSGKVNGVDVNVDGRFDAPAPGSPWKIRFTCNYRDANGHSGRIFGLKDG